MRTATLAGLVGIASVPTLATAQVRIQGLGPTPAGELRDYDGFALSSDGSTIVANVGGRAFRWRESEGWRELPPLPSNNGRSAQVQGVSSSGRFAVGTSQSATVPGAAEAVLWDELGPALALGDLPGGSFNSFGHSVSQDGNVVVGASNALDSGPPSIFRWVRGQGMSNLGGVAQPSPNFDDIPRAICSANGSIVFGHLSEPSRARRWAGAWAFLGSLPGGNVTNWVRGIAPSGNYAVGEDSSAEGQVGYLWSQERGMEWLGMSPFGTTNGTVAFGVSEGGGTVVGSGPTGWLSQATIWQRQHGWRNLKLVLLTEYGMTQADGWTMANAAAISADGQTIAGRGVNPCGRQDIWLVRLLPQTPSCPPDFNADGFLDFFDYDAFVGAFEVGIPAADFNGDCFLDFFDYDGFVEAFETGC
jgi:uncharacterized membrane protein